MTNVDSAQSVVPTACEGYPDPGVGLRVCQPGHLRPYHPDRTWVCFLLSPASSSKAGLLPQEAEPSSSRKELGEALFGVGQQIQDIPDSLLDTKPCRAPQAAGETRLPECLTPVIPFPLPWRNFSKEHVFCCVSTCNSACLQVSLSGSEGPQTRG